MVRLVDGVGVRASGGLISWARKALGARSDLDRNDFVLAGAYLPMSVMSQAWRRRGRLSVATARRFGVSSPSVVAPTGTIRAVVEADGSLRLVGLGSLACVTVPTLLTPSDVAFVAVAGLAGTSSAVNDGLALFDRDGQWWVLVPTPNTSAYLLDTLASHGWNVVRARATYRCGLFGNLAVTMPPSSATDV